MIGAYLQPNGATWEPRVVGTDGKPVLSETGQRTYGAPAMIPARVKAKIKLVRTPSGEQVPTQAEITTTALVNEGDKVNGRGVIALETRLGLTGGEVWRVVYT